MAQWKEEKTYVELEAEAQAALLQPNEIYVANGIAGPEETRETAEARLRAYYLDPLRGYDLHEVRFDWDHVVDGFGTTHSGEEFAEKVAHTRGGWRSCAIIGKKK